ncbi:hypothetical protein NL676_007107 [Syzygium grande]|nr:hypothetical protein NL676_007107 [Syzygium grande]
MADMQQLREQQLREDIRQLEDNNKKLEELISNRISRTQEFTNMYFVFQGLQSGAVERDIQTLLPRARNINFFSITS